jgi:uncharacterized protein (TIGR02421 family)
MSQILACDAAISDPAQIDRALCMLGKTILPLRHLDPINDDAEKAKFMAGSTENPQFEYRKIDDGEYHSARQALESLAPDNSPIGKIFDHTRTYLLRRLELRRSIGTSDFWAPELYGRIPGDLIQLAERMLKDGRRYETGNETIYGVELVIGMMEQALRRYGVTGWKVQARSNISATNVESVNRVINVQADQRYSMMTAKRLVVHEIETHVLRAANGYEQPYGIFGAAVIPGYLATEEGLALVNEERAGYIDRPRLRVLASRVMAAHLACLYSFREIFERLLEYHLSREEAWVTVKRVKRGLDDTSKPGGYIKDHVYLWGKIKLEEFIVQGGDLAALYVGKVGLDHLDLLRGIDLRPPRYLPRSYLPGG